ncbi:MAG: PepSY-like domain-containing protein [Muribaculaceae bacterium]|nr:PepSY-like domain-containing protein [Muribaculaceae bacterium]
MKRLAKILSLAALVLAFAIPSAQAERVYKPVSDMPAQVQTFLNDYYPGVKVSKSWWKMMRATTQPMWYRVNLENGTKIAFDLQGNWYQVSNKNGNVPTTLLPNDARGVISKDYKNETVKSIKFKKDSYKVKLTNGTMLKFDKTYGLQWRKDKK